MAGVLVAGEKDHVTAPRLPLARSPDLDRTATPPPYFPRAATIPRDGSTHLLSADSVTPASPVRASASRGAVDVPALDDLRNSGG